MDNWFDDNFFATEDPRDMHRHIDDMHRRMSDMVDSMFSHFRDLARFGLGFNEPDPFPAIQDRSTQRSRSRAGSSFRSQPIIEDPDDFGTELDQPQSYFYSTSMTAYSGPDGVTHAKRKTYNSKTGKTQFAEMRKIGDRAVARKREIDADGTVHEEVDRRNLDESEIDDFERRWQSRRTRALPYERSASRDITRRRALK
jgi:hypothetical protein